MDAKKKKLLEDNGWKVGNVEEFLDLSKEEFELIELKILLGNRLATLRKSKNMTQSQFAKKIRSSQSRVAKMEKGDPTVTIDRILKSMFVLGATKEEFLSYCC